MSHAIDQSLTSWVPGARKSDPTSGEFPIQNLPICVAVQDGHEHVCVAIGDHLLDLEQAREAGLLSAAVDGVGFLGDADNIATSGKWPAIRQRLVELLRSDADKQLIEKATTCLRDRLTARFDKPMSVRNYTDFYASVHHATNVGRMFRPDNPLLPNYKHIPIGYHGRPSSIVVSGTSIKRPKGQTKADTADAPTFGPCTMLDYELEVGAYIAKGNDLGHPVSIRDARATLFGLCLVNDWSARDVQKWEYQPLGPFLAKNFATSVSPYVVTMEALEPFRCAAYERPAGDPRPLEYLLDADDQSHGGFDVTLEVSLESAQMREKMIAPMRVSRGSLRFMYWTFAQMLAHHTSGGCNMHPGDLIASGTVSGPEPESRGCLLELTWQGLGPDNKPLPRKPITLPTGETRTFLADGDRVIIRGFCEAPGKARISFGECEGLVLPA
ncbi:MAG: fumarylacetoacetase [Phycisphaerales bacterium]|nr:MAG: fumarylacetoacetase [Phycisphaerales bacterium]